MQWKVKKSYKNGEIRKRKGFLFLPKHIGGITKWLCLAKWEEELIGCSQGCFFKEHKWIE